MTGEQKIALEAPFPPEEVKSREGSFGKQLDYVEGHSVIRRMNSALQGNWSFEIVEHLVKDEEVIVVGKLRVGDITKMQIGSSRITRARGTGEVLSLGEDFKAAATDSLKKCATMLGVALYLYGNHNEEKPTTGRAAAAGQTRTSSSPSVSEQSQTQRPGSSGKGRLSQKQHQLIVKLGTEAGLNREELNRHCRQTYGCVVDFLTKADASCLIEALFAGQVKAA